VNWYWYVHIESGTIANMLDCTWNDSEAETALRRLLLKEQKQQKLLASNPKISQKLRESALARLALKRIVGVASTSSTF
jgi:hypothetical protein